MVVSFPHLREVNLGGVRLSQRDVEVVPLERITRFYLANHFLLHKAEKQDLVDVVRAKQVVDDLGAFMNVEHTTILLKSETT
jgi:hypothetical protein